MACGDPSAAVRIALLDPELSMTAPRHVTAMAGFDAIAHAVETAVTVKRTPLSDTFSHQAWKLLNDAFERVLLTPADPEARSAMTLGSHFAGMAIEQSMLGAAHACANLPSGSARQALLAANVCHAARESGGSTPRDHRRRCRGSRPSRWTCWGELGERRVSCIAGDKQHAGRAAPQSTNCNEEQNRQLCTYLVIGRSHDRDLVQHLPKCSTVTNNLFEVVFRTNLGFKVQALFFQLVLRGR